MSRKQIKRTAGNMVYTAIAGFFIVVVVCGVGLGVASANSVDDIAHAGAFGFNAVTNDATSSPRADSADAPKSANESFYERSVLAYSTPRDITAGMYMIDSMERIERERVTADNVAVLSRVSEKRGMQGVTTSPEAVSSASAEYDYAYGLPSVDWSVGYDAFMAEWTARIDAYLDGSPLSGYGKVFAKAAWDNGVDPRWSPAISNTESSKGLACFLPCNAWGWGNTGWDDWETAIPAHITGLAKGYGYSITVEAAQSYCPPHWPDWYRDTLDQMASI